MPNKLQILETLTRSLLLDIARTFELSGLTAKPKKEILGALMGKRSIPAEDILDILKVWTPQRVLVCFGPEHAPLEQRTVEESWQEARQFKPDILLFCAFQFDEEAAKDIDEMKPEIAGMQLLKADERRSVD